MELNASKIALGEEMDPNQLKDACRTALQKAFQQVVSENRGKLEAKAAEIGVRRQQLEQYADGTIPRSEVLLAAFIAWGLQIRTEDQYAAADDPRWWECGMTQKDRARQKRTAKPEQLPLFRAIEDLAESDMDLKIVKRGAGRIQLSLDILFKNKIA